MSGIDSAFDNKEHEGIDMSEWIEWNGGKCPVSEGTKVDVKHRDGDIFYKVPAGTEEAHDWTNEGFSGDIVAYRVVENDNVNTPSHYLENFRAAMREELSNWRDPKQVDGQHYADLVIQPLDVAYLNGMNSARTKVLKYVMREKNGLKDLKKAYDMVAKCALYEYGVNLDEEYENDR